MFSCQVILGGGRQYMFPKTAVDPEYSGTKGTRNDGLDLTAEWLKNKKVNIVILMLKDYTDLFLIIYVTLLWHKRIRRKKNKETVQ